MALTAQQVREAAVSMVQAEQGLGTMSKADLTAAVAAADQWATDNATAFNTTLPQPFRGAATTGQKAALLSFVCLRRWAG